MTRTEKRRAGLVALAVCLSAAGTAQAQQIAFTWDDLPSHGALPEGMTRVEIGDRIIAAWKAAKLPPVYGFVNGARTVEEPESTMVLDHWRAAGLPLGNHAWSHMNLATHSAAEFEQDVIKGEGVVAGRMKGLDWHWFRYPNLSEGETPEKKAAVRKLLADRGYRIAGVTMSFGDYMWNAPYARCVARKDDKAIAWLEKSYLAAADDSITYGRTVFKSLLGRDIPYVLLMHVGALDAVMLPRLIDLYRRRGFTFVTLEQAQRDPWYKGYMNPRLPDAPVGPEAQLRAKGLPVPTRHDYGPELEAICK
ncbi:polysaccharide deacetylase family protein [Sphingomonas sp. QA11]|uniref:polysaccharide deacetylase family protein n=1 Tax=Sphingomonas sp. QA11 TaxID=2950605 RepID=UPI00234B306E|nr:polysaccharide deacetylase family protein [Sphingomonas sp. QA11]WCM27044.1 polysaccharide deacetylase family protein [Sphingomonas sp. QA11]